MSIGKAAIYYRGRGITAFGEAYKGGYYYTMHHCLYDGQASNLTYGCEIEITSEAV